MHFLRRSRVHLAVRDKHPAERRYRVARKSVLPSIENRGAGSYSACVVMLQYCKSRLCKIRNQINGSVYVEQIVVRNLLAVQFLEHILEPSEELSFLMGIFSVAQVRNAVDCHTERRSVVLVEIVEYRAVIQARHSERLLGEETAVGKACDGIAVFLNDAAQRGILVLGSHNHHIVVILGGCTYQRYSADVDFLDYVGFRSSRSHGFLKRIQINHNEVDFRYFIFSYLLLVALIVAAVQYSAEHFRMQRLHASSKNRRIACQILHRVASISETFDKRLCSACRKEFHTVSVQQFEHLVQSVLMIDRDKGSFDFFIVSHCSFIFRFNPIFYTL